jgi:transposase InsO family protein
LEVVGRHGLPLSLYTDRGSHYFHTPEAGGPVDRKHLTQVGRALTQLGVEHIAAYSPQARGRSERLFGTPAFALVLLSRKITEPAAIFLLERRECGSL